MLTITINFADTNYVRRLTNAEIAMTLEFVALDVFSNLLPDNDGAVITVECPQPDGTSFYVNVLREEKIDL